MGFAKEGTSGAGWAHVGTRPTLMETSMTWTTPAYQDLRFGFEITMYIAAR